MTQSISNFVGNTLFLPKMLVVAIVPLLSACASTTQPIGDWARPSDLELDSSSLEDTRVTVKCGRLKGEKIEEELGSEICSALKTALANIGAQDVSGDVANDKRADLTVWYLDTGTTTTKSNWVSDVAFYFTGGLVPIISTSTAEAELRVTDSRGAVLDRSQMRVDEVRSFGWLSLASQMTRGKRLVRKKDIERRFFRFVQNRVYSQAVRLRLAKGEEI